MKIDQSTKPVTRSQSRKFAETPSKPPLDPRAGLFAAIKGVPRKRMRQRSQQILARPCLLPSSLEEAGTRKSSYSCENINLTQKAVTADLAAAAEAAAIRSAGERMWM